MAAYLSRKQTDLGNTLVRMGACEEQHVARAREAQKAEPSKLLGELLVESGEVTVEEVEAALVFQKQLRNGKAINAMVAINDALTDAALKAG